LATTLETLSLSLDLLDRSEEALSSADEAVAIRRGRNSEPDLARSLSMLACRLENLDRLPEALDADEEALQILAASLQRYSAMHSDREAIVQGYVSRCGKADREPDANLVAPILESLPPLAY